EDLDKQALVQILSKPKNAIIKQYQKLFEFENVRLKFSDDALEAIAALAMERKVGARGLRMILEDLMLDLMYYIPSHEKVREFQVTKEMVLAQTIRLMLLEKTGLNWLLLAERPLTRWLVRSIVRRIAAPRVTDAPSERSQLEHLEGTCMLASPPAHTIEQWPLSRFVPYARNPRKNDHAVDRMAASIREF